MSTKRRGNYSPGMSMPGSGTSRSGRGIFGILLCLILPPVGLMFLWRKGVFQTRGRILVTALATIEMAIVISLMMPVATISTATPIPGSTVRFTPAPQNDVLTALSNIDQLLREQEIDETTGLTIDPEAQAQAQAEQQAILATTVYAVYDSDARYYHSVTVCGNQSNLRSLTVQEAIGDGLMACPDCNPPIYSALDALGVGAG